MRASDYKGGQAVKAATINALSYNPARLSDQLGRSYVACTIKS